jgi:RNA-directed DNA polymerase
MSDFEALRFAGCGESAKTGLRGWYEYFKHSKSNVFEPIDGYVRGRLRSILRKRRGRTGRGRGNDHQRWPNSYFTTLGLFSLQQVHAVACRSS